jgi:hypothetical protein
MLDKTLKIIFLCGISIFFVPICASKSPAQVRQEKAAKAAADRKTLRDKLNAEAKGRALAAKQARLEKQAVEAAKIAASIKARQEKLPKRAVAQKQPVASAAAPAAPVAQRKCCTASKTISYQKPHNGSSWLITVSKTVYCQGGFNCNGNHWWGS